MKTYTQYTYNLQFCGSLCILFPPEHNEKETLRNFSTLKTKFIINETKVKLISRFKYFDYIFDYIFKK